MKRIAKGIFVGFLVIFLSAAISKNVLCDDPPIIEPLPELYYELWVDCFGEDGGEAPPQPEEFPETEPGHDPDDNDYFDDDNQVIDAELVELPDWLWSLTEAPEDDPAPDLDDQSRGQGGSDGGRRMQRRTSDLHNSLSPAIGVVKSRATKARRPSKAEIFSTRHSRPKKQPRITHPSIHIGDDGHAAAAPKNIAKPTKARKTVSPKHLRPACRGMVKGSVQRMHRR